MSTSRPILRKTGERMTTYTASLLVNLSLKATQTSPFKMLTRLSILLRTALHLPKLSLLSLKSLLHATCKAVYSYYLCPFMFRSVERTFM